MALLPFGMLALVPLCVNGATSPQVHPEYKRFAPAVWWGAYVEVYGALCRLHCEKKISGRGKQGASERLRSLRRAWREVLPSVEVRDLALQSLEKYPLRAADGLQLAASLVWCAERPSKRRFICSGQRLAKAASAAGFSVIELLTTVP